MVQDQTLFIWLISTISESVLPRVLSCKHSFEVWDKIHKHFNAMMKAKVFQQCYELKTTKKDNCTVSEYFLKIKLIADSLLAVGDVITEEAQIDVILDGLLEEYSSFMMQMHGKSESPTLYDVEALLYVQEGQLDKFHQELALSNVSANLAISHSKQNAASN
ncbi:unnamed protein product [Vicia faba]|uniref:Retrovirus-related Pol polyprotein from transposon TNT 1-94 n=1 Tax=Vicia faba TaxID=3906 RepID=A0AAV0YSY9_VICFA|nr:unnamed protein product [Vicia faba]